MNNFIRGYMSLRNHFDQARSFQLALSMYVVCDNGTWYKLRRVGPDMIEMRIM